MRPKKAVLKAKGRALLEEQVNLRYPGYNIMDPKTSMLHNLNYYSTHVDSKLKKKYALDYWKSQGKSTKEFLNVSDCWFSTLGAVAHMFHKRHIALDQFDIDRLEAAYHQLLKIAPEEDRKTKVVVTIQDRIQEMIKTNIGEIEHAFDELVENGTVFDMKTYAAVNDLKAPVLRGIGDWFKPKIAEYNAYKKEWVKNNPPETKIAFHHVGAKGLDRAVEFFTNIVADCNTLSTIARTTKAPRKSKPKPPSVIVRDLQYLREDAMLGITSVDPTKIVESDEVWLYNTKKRFLYRYVARDGYRLSVKRSTISNFDPEKSCAKIIRKPDDVLDVIASGKRAASAKFKEINAQPKMKLSGRVNNEFIILGVYH